MGRLIGLLAVLNLVVLTAGMSMEQVRGQPGVLLDFNADKVRLLGRAERTALAPAKTPEKAPEAVMPPQPAEATNQPVAKPATESAQPQPRCLFWKKLDDNLLGEIETRIQSAGIAESSYVIHLQKHLGWWVYLPPFSDVEAMQAAMDAARQKGAKDIAPVRGGAMENAVSLGAFPTLALARAQLEKLRALGIPGVRMGPRPKSGTARMVIADSVAEARLAGLSQGWNKGRAPLVCRETER
jgi:hypothetical protein